MLRSAYASLTEARLRPETVERHSRRGAYLSSASPTLCILRSTSARSFPRSRVAKMVRLLRQATWVEEYWRKPKDGAIAMRGCFTPLWTTPSVGDSDEPGHGRLTPAGSAPAADTEKICGLGKTWNWWNESSVRDGRWGMAVMGRSCIGSP